MGAAAALARPVYAPGGGVSGSAGRSRFLHRLAACRRARRGIGGDLRSRILRVQPPAGYVRGGSVNAIEVRDVRKLYRRYGRRSQFGTLKSALLSRGGGADSPAATTFEALR